MSSIQYRVNRLRTSTLAAESAVQQLHKELNALKGEVDQWEMSSAEESLQRAESALESIRQVSERMGAQK